MQFIYCFNLFWEDFSDLFSRLHCIDKIIFFFFAFFLLVLILLLLELLLGCWYKTNSNIVWILFDLQLAGIPFNVRIAHIYKKKRKK